MRRVSMFLGIGILAAGTVTMPTQCQQESKLKEFYEKGSVTYRTRPGDNPYTLAKRFYGKGYLAYKIRDANKDLLTEEEFFPTGTEIVVPPDLRGRLIDVTRPEGKRY